MLIMKIYTMLTKYYKKDKDKDRDNLVKTNLKEKGLKAISQSE